jgi:hypothetical protein
MFHHALDRNAQRAPDEPGKKYENDRKQERPLERGRIGQATGFDLIEEMHGLPYSVLILLFYLASLGMSAAIEVIKPKFAGSRICTSAIGLANSFMRTCKIAAALAATTARSVKGL